MRSYVNKFVSVLIDRYTGKKVSVADLADLVNGGGTGSGVTSVNGQTGAVTVVEVPELPVADGDYQLNISSGVASWELIE